MKKTLLITLLISSLLTAFFLWEKNASTEAHPQKEYNQFPTPTEINMSAEEKMREEAESQEEREAWFEDMHRVAPGVDWKAIESRTRYERHQKRVAQKYSANHRGGGEEVLADGNLIGEWEERGSKNQAGRVVATDYDPIADEIWLISDGGTLFKGPRDGSDWQVINDDLKFNDGFLKAIPHNGARRWLAFIDDEPHYSDDEGVSWISSFGVAYSESSGSFHEPVILDDADNSIYVLSKSTGSSDVALYRSTDHGQIFIQIHSWGVNDFRRFRMRAAHNSDALYIMYRGGDSEGLLNVFKVNGAQIEVIGNSGISLGNQRVNFSASVVDTDTILYTHDGDMNMHRSMDGGVTWEERGEMPITPWSVGIYVAKSDPNILYTGNIECYQSSDGGQTWVSLGDWWEYYNDVEFSIHADMMNFAEYYTSDNQRFMLISNDGGLTISNDDYFNLFNGYQNIGMENLNVSQYYDVRTDFDPSNYFIYAGAQDQGFQRAFTNFSNEGTLEFEQTISGDYGHISFSKNGERMWAVYPGGLVHYYDDPEYGGVADGWTIESNTESPAWIPPMMDAPNQEEDHVFIVGGSAEVDGNGRYIIQLEWINNPGSNDYIEATNLPFEFNTAAAGAPTSIAASKIDYNRWYVATSNGGFLTSNDYGQTWNISSADVPDGQYLYGQAILPSVVDIETVYLGGSGYSNAGVIKSIDGGATFSDMSNGLPSTMVYDLATNSDESLIFAATQAGPYVYVVAEDLWYDMSGMYAPAQTYWSVEFLEEEDGSATVRYGTYGRGIWDFKIVDELSNNNIAKENFDFKVFPNPAREKIQLEWNLSESSIVNAQLFDLSGKLILEKNYNSISNLTQTESLNLTNLSPGEYFLRLENDQKVGTEKILIMK